MYIVRCVVKHSLKPLPDHSHFKALQELHVAIPKELQTTTCIDIIDCVDGFP